MDAMLNVSLHGILFIAGFYGDSRGEEMPLLSLDAIFRACKCMPCREREIEGRCPGRGLPSSIYSCCHCVWTNSLPVGTESSGGLCKFGHNQRMDVPKQERRSRENGFYEPYMFELIQRVQDAGVVAERLLPREEDITVSHGIARSGRRGYATHATNVGIADADIKRLARWRVIEAAAGRAASLTGGTKEGYSAINQMIKSLLRASRLL
jgi:hypothetical protein